MKKEIKKVEKIISITEIFVLLVATVSFAYILGSEIGFVSGQSSAVAAASETAEIAKLQSAVAEHIASTASTTPIAPVPTSAKGWGDAIDAALGKGTTTNPPAVAPPAPAAPQSSGGFFSRLFGIGGGDPKQANEGGAANAPSKGIFGGLGGIFFNLGAAATVYGIIKLVGNVATNDQGKVDAAAAALGLGTFAGLTAASFVSSTSWKGLFGLGSTGTGLLIGGVVAIGVFLLMYKQTSTEIVQYQCLPWDSSTGGSNCEKCNSQGILPCSEYQCRSLGQACQLLNKGTKEERCTWVNRGDTKVPIIKPWNDVLLDGYKYTPDNTISPPDNGVKIVKTDSTTGCIKAFTPLRFGINVDEPAKCKLDYIRKEKFDDMQFYFGESSLFAYNHTQTLSLPGPSALNNESPIIQNDGTYNLFVRCMDANGNTNPANFVFKFCVEKGPDTTPPLIVSTSLLNGMPIAYNQSSVPIDVYTNEPSDCKWSKTDQKYDSMENSMSCSRSVFEMNAQSLYKCSTTLNGLKNRENNDFYFRCKDQPLKPENERNVNLQSYKFSLIGTQPLVIDYVKPNETIRDSTDVVKVKLEAQTSAGYKDGEASCYYSDTGEDDSYILFFNTGKTGTNKHSQDLFLPNGNYKYYIKCIDLGGNADTKVAQFSVESDSSAPIIVRVYHEETYLKLITNEKATCVYSKDSCNYQFKDGIVMQVLNDKEQFTEWNTNFNYYIKCQDDFGNQPLPSQCSIIARPYEVLEVKKS